MMCDNPPEETLEHMLFQCPFSLSCWQSLGVHFDPTGDRLHIAESWKNTWHKPFFMEIFLLASWNIWKTRNSLLFDGITPTFLAWKMKLRNDLQLLLHRIRSDRHDVIKELIVVL
jgi:hypothetical protein